MSQVKTYTTKEIADIVHVHPNTVRLYEEWGLISKPERKPNGYRVFTEKHIDEMTLARLTCPGPYAISSKPLYDMMNVYIKGDYELSMTYAKMYQELLMQEQLKSKESLRALEKWNEGQWGSNEIIATGRKAFAKMLRVSVETLRTWERNDLYSPTINQKRYKKYSEFDFEKVKIIRFLRKAGFSIDSLYQMFHTQEGQNKPSYFLEVLYKNTETEHKASAWMDFLEEDIQRIRKIISYLEKKL